jgi:hypothetical protein
MQHDEESTMTDKPMDDYGRHEVLHMSLFLCNSVGNELLEHEQIKNNPAWQALAQTAHQALFDLYQAIGAVHLLEGKKD